MSEFLKQPQIHALVAQWLNRIGQRARDDATGAAAQCCVAFSAAIALAAFLFYDAPMLSAAGLLMALGFQAIRLFSVRGHARLKAAVAAIRFPDLLLTCPWLFARATFLALRRCSPLVPSGTQTPERPLALRI